MARIVDQKSENRARRPSGSSHSTVAADDDICGARLPTEQQCSSEMAAGLESPGKRRQWRDQRQRAIGKRFGAVTGVPVGGPLVLRVNDHQNAAHFFAHPDAAQSSSKEELPTIDEEFNEMRIECVRGRSNGF